MTVRDKLALFGCEKARWCFDQILFVTVPPTSHNEAALKTLRPFSDNLMLYSD